jgi:hypothetical protein
MRRIAFTGLIHIAFPGYDLRLTDGGFIVWGANTYRAKDAVFGVVAGVESMNEGVGEEVPVFQLSLLPPGETAPGDLSQPGFQSSRARFWIAEYDVDDGTLIGTPDLQFDGQVDQTSLEFSREATVLSMSIVSNTARLMERNIGNSLNSTFHKSVWPGELGQDNATGLGEQVAWGVEKPNGSGGGGFRDLINKLSGDKPSWLPN